MSPTPYLVSMLFSRPRWSFFQGVPDLWWISVEHLPGLFSELKTFWDNLGLHVLLITLWWHMKIILCTNFYEKFDRKKISNFFYIEFDCQILSNFFYNEFGCKNFSKFFEERLIKLWCFHAKVWGFTNDLLLTLHNFSQLTDFQKWS